MFSNKVKVDYAKVRYDSSIGSPPLSFPEYERWLKQRSVFFEKKMRITAQLTLLKKLSCLLE